MSRWSIICFIQFVSLMYRYALSIIFMYAYHFKIYFLELKTKMMCFFNTDNQPEIGIGLMKILSRYIKRKRLHLPTCSPVSGIRLPIHPCPDTRLAHLRRGSTFRVCQEHSLLSQLVSLIVFTLCMASPPGELRNLSLQPSTSLEL